MLEESWIESTRNLCQWNVIRDVAKSMGDPLLMAEACSKLGEWNVLQDLLRRIHPPLTRLAPCFPMPTHLP